MLSRQSVRRIAWGRIVFGATIFVGAVALLLPDSALASSPASGTAARASAFYTFKDYPTADARNPTFAGVIQGGDGRIYGVGDSGGTCSNGGAVYSIGLGDTGDTLLHSFPCNSSGQSDFSSGGEYNPGNGGIADGGDGWYYGTTQQSYDSTQAGQIYRVKPDGTYQVVHVWSSSVEGGAANPNGRILLASDGWLYGVTTNGGSCGKGSVWRLKPSASLPLAYQRVYSFCHTDGQDDIGTYPVAGLVQGQDGAFYGTTSRGGANPCNCSSFGAGTVFKLTVDASGVGTLTTLHSFADPIGRTGTGADPESVLLPAHDGTSFYGTTVVGDGSGTIYKVTSAGAYSVIGNIGGGTTQQGLVYGPGDFLYGATWSGGAHNCGQLYAVDPDSGSVAGWLYSFDCGSGGADPDSALTAATDGNFYGTTQIGGSTGNSGVLYKASFVAVRVRVPADGATYYQGQVANADYGCYGSGDTANPQCTGDVPVGQPVDTSTLGSHSFTVTGTDHNGTQATRTVSYNVIPSPVHSTSTSVSCTPASVSIGNQTSCTATVTDMSGSPTTPQGTVSFSSDSKGTFGSNGSCTLSNGSCQVSYTPSAVGSGTHTITASYGGDTTHSSSSGSTGVTVTTRSTGTSVSCSPPSVSVGNSTTCTATVTDNDKGSSSTPSGTVSFLTDSSGSFSSSSCTLSNGSCQVSYTASAVGSGTHTITASYGGDTTHSSSSGSTGVTVTTRSTGTSVSCSPGTVVIGQATTCTVTVTDTDGGSGSTPGGTVKFSSDQNGTFGSGGSCALSNGSCQVSYTPSVAGTHTITANYDGDSTHSSSSGQAKVTVLSFTLLAYGSFVIGDKNPTAVGAHVTFWGAQWWKLNPLSTGGPQPGTESFKGFAKSIPSNPPKCGDTWVSRPGNSPPPPDTVPQYMAVIVSTSITKGGPDITGNIKKVVVVKTDPGYAPNPGHAGTGTITAIVCSS